ncbi:SCO0930 family lipoprotein [Streptomyces sp. NPDC001889]
MRNVRTAGLIASATAVIMLTAACGGAKEDKGQAANAAAPATPAAAPAQADGAKPVVAGRLSIWKTSAIGPVVTDSAGFTLYRFDNDTAQPPKSTCEGDCAKAWPPVLAKDAQAAAGMDPSLVGKVARADGSEQLTLAGWPLYRFAKDTAPRQTGGQGVGGTWFAAAPDGKKAAPAAPAPEAAASEAGGGGDTAASLPPLSTRDDAGLGRIVRDAKGRTLYRFIKDTDWPMKSNCVGACLDTWKPAKMLDKAAVKAVEGIDPKLVINYKRPDNGTDQLTLDCWPLYWFTGDQKPGDTNGQGVGGTWFAVKADGTLAK